MKKTLVTILGVLMTFPLWAVGILVNRLSYYLDDTNMTAEVVSHYSYKKNLKGELIIPEIVSYQGLDYQVTSIGEYAFKECEEVTAITMPNSVIYIGEGAFLRCGVTSILLSNNLDSISKFCFSSCGNLVAITIPDNVTAIGRNAFSSCGNLVAIAIPDNVTTIGCCAFKSCTSLESVKIGKGVQNIERDISAYYNIFEKCSALTSIHVDPNNSVYDSRNNCNAIIETATNTLIAGCQGTIIPNSVTNIANRAFSYCTNLKSMVIPNSVTYIGEQAFIRCESLESINLGNGVRTIESNTFEGCLSLTAITIPNSVDTIGDGAFYNCISLDSVKIGNRVTHIGDDAFRSCVELASVTIPHSVITIGGHAFQRCWKLTSASIGSGVTTLDSQIFYDCSLDSMVCYAAVPPICNSYTFSGIWKSIPVFVPAESLEAYKQAPYWEEFTNFQPIAARTIESDGTITVLPTNTEASFVWPLHDGADSYTLEIKKGEVVSCTLYFNGNGELTNMASAPAYDTKKIACSYAQLDNDGYWFTVTGLDEGTYYTYTLTVTDVNNNILQQYTGQFQTTGGTGLEYAIQQEWRIEKECIIFPEKKNVQVYTLDGMCVYNGWTDRVMLDKGIYMVCSDDVTIKVKMQ